MINRTLTGAVVVAIIYAWLFLIFGMMMAPVLCAKLYKRGIARYYI